MGFFEANKSPEVKEYRRRYYNAAQLIGEALEQVSATLDDPRGNNYITVDLRRVLVECEERAGLR